MRILREIMAVSLAFLLVLPSSVQAVRKEKVKIGYVNSRIFVDGDMLLLVLKYNTEFRSELISSNRGLWLIDRASDVKPGYTELFKYKEAFDNFVREANKCKVMKIIDIPKPPADFAPAESSCSYNACNYLNLTTGNYESNSFHRSETSVSHYNLPFKAGSYTYIYEFWYFEVEASEAESINDKLIFRPKFRFDQVPRYHRQANTNQPPQPQGPLSAPPESTAVEQVNRVQSDLIIRVVLALTLPLTLSGVGLRLGKRIGLYMRHNRKKREEAKAEAGRNKGLRGWIHRIIRKNKKEF
ncbi:MAG: hypothetical protein LBL71_03425 [Endomicrobium sp.]|jgi:hypothetical protein|nr:hypothetical protein [Endomicrobium sp.]